MGAIFLLWLLAIAAVEDAKAASSEVSASTPAASSCPMNFTYIHTLPWNPGACLSDTPKRGAPGCCETLLLLFGVGLSLRLRHTDNFRLPDEPTSAACLSAYQSHLNLRSLPRDVVSSCFPNPKRFVISPNACAGIMTGADMTNKLGSQSALFTACKSDMSASVNCDSCFNAGVTATTELARIDGNASHSTECFYLLCTFAAGVVNEFGPENPATARCLIGLPLVAVPVGHDRKNRLGLIIPLALGFVGILLVCSLLAGVYFWRRKPARAIPRGNSSASRPNIGAEWFELEELELATGDFSRKNMIDKRSLGVVYRGVLSDGTTVAVQKIESGIYRDEDFFNIVEVISKLHHRNLVPLRGCCISSDIDDEETGEGKQRYLIYEYMPNGSLNDHIFGRTPLTWPQRKDIIVDVARGLTHMHYDLEPAIYHRNIKTKNILLDREMRARVANFGTVKQKPGDELYMPSKIAGTHGYLAPEYALYGQLTEKSDVYSFGIVVLEVMCGRKALDMASSSESLLITDWAWALVKAGEGAEALDPSLLRDEEDRPPNPVDIMQRFVMVGILCAHSTASFRPTIREALSMLEGDVDVPPLPDRPLPIGHGFQVFSEIGNYASSPAHASSSLDLDACEMLR